MAFAQGSRSRLVFASQTDFSTVKADADDAGFANLPFTSHTLNLSKERVSGNDIQPDRMARVDRHGNKTVAGDINVDLRDAAYDDFLESAMMGSWSSNVLKVGTSAKYFTIEDYAADIDQARLFSGMSVNSMNVSVAPNQMISTTFGMIGRDMTISATQLTNGVTGISAAGESEPFDSYSGDIKIANSGASLGSGLTLITSLDFTLSNNLTSTLVIGEETASDVLAGRAEVEGTLTAYFEDASLINRFLDETESAIEFSVQDNSSNSMTFLFPRVKFNSADAGVEGPDARIVNMSFVGLYDATEATSLKITRSA